jgi:hypothetical protein
VIPSALLGSNGGKESAMDESIDFRRSSFCTDAHGCVEVAVGKAAVRVRDSKGCGEQELTFTPAEWAAFVAGVKAGEFD